ncbi:transposase family protein [Glutamicibacter sp. NPDC087344]|uniref:transposase family protein n=1 Tax=Glutamicibacter sp. NPDC087344 TaxID=3363994 RepID=UPI00382DAEBC
MPRRTHDWVTFTRTGVEQLLADSSYLADLDYQGRSGMIPHKKGHRAGAGELIKHDQLFNKVLSKHRASVERGNAHLENWKILAEDYRGVFHELQAVIRSVSLLGFFRGNASGTKR